MYETYCKLRDNMGCKDSDVAKATGITKSTFSDWKSGRSNPKNDKLQKIADYFGVTLEYLLTGKDEKEGDEPCMPKLTPRDERDIKKTVDSLMNKLDSKDGAPLYYGEHELTQETRILFESQLTALVRTVKEINKEKYGHRKKKK